MVEPADIAFLKRTLRHEVTALCRWNRQPWKLPFTSTIRAIKDNDWPAVFFGGTLRSLLVSRIVKKSRGRPRDIDIVLGVPTIDELRSEFHPWITRQTRFGGLALSRKGWEFDVWPVHETFAFKMAGGEPRFEDLPKTTLLNAEAIAVEVWPKPGKPRQVYSWDDRFFHGVLTRTLELNQPANPYPKLSVLRSLVIANQLAWRVGPRLANFLAMYGTEISESELIEIQMKHYKAVRLPWDEYSSLLRKILDALESGQVGPIELSRNEQIPLWSQGASSSRKSEIKLIGPSRRRRHSGAFTSQNLCLLQIQYC